jgi:hypothetical protein
MSGKASACIRAAKGVKLAEVVMGDPISTRVRFSAASNGSQDIFSGQLWILDLEVLKSHPAGKQIQDE